MILAALLPSILPGAAWAPGEHDLPLLRILAMLFFSVGLPYFVLASTSPLVQTWMHQVDPDRPPWRLFAMSNAGSMLAVISYPVLIEPVFGVAMQAHIWKWSFGVFAALSGVVLWQLVQATPRPAVAAAAAGSAPATGSGSESAARRRSLWVAWSATSVVLFMAVTNQLSLNIASIPLLWVIPLGTYLLSFIAAFAGPMFYPRRLFAALLGPATVALFV